MKAGGKKRSSKKAPAKRAPSRAKKAPAKKLAKKAPARAKKAPAKKLAKKASRRAVREELTMVTELPASPAEVIAAWLDSAAHTAFTGADASIDARVGGKHSAWSGYIEGTLAVLEPHRLVMSWRTTEFLATDPDSRLEIIARPAPRGARIEILHTDLPEGGAEKYSAGWRDFYFAPMAKYFAR